MDKALLWVSGVGSGLTAIATLGLVWVAWRTLGGARDQLILLQRQAAREGRPYVIAEVVPGLHGAGSSDLVVRNVGRTMARHIVIEIGTVTKRNEDDYISEPLAEYLAQPKTLAPGSRHRVMWRSEPRDDSGREEAGAPKRARGLVSYTDDEGLEYSEDYDLSVETLMQSTPVPTSGPRTHGEGKDLANIDRALRTLNQHVGELRR